MSSENVSETLSYVTDIESAEKLLHEHDLETTTCFVMYYSYGVGKGKPKVRGAPQMNSGYERECCMEGCRGVGFMGRPRGEGDPKTFHCGIPWKLHVKSTLSFGFERMQKLEKME